MRRVSYLGAGREGVFEDNPAVGGLEGLLDAPPCRETWGQAIGRVYRILFMNRGVGPNGTPRCGPETGHMPIDFVIVTPLAEERKAVLDQLPGHRKVAASPDDIRVYYSAEVPVRFADG